MAKHKAGQAQDGATAAKRVRARAPKGGPLSFRGRLALAARVTKALEGLTLERQRGVVGIVALTGGLPAEALLHVLRILAGVDASDRQAVVDVVAACLGGEAEVVAGGEAVQLLVPGSAGTGEAAE